MIQTSISRSHPPRSLEVQQKLGPIGELYDVTMAGGTALIGTNFSFPGVTAYETENYSVTWTEIIILYERKIAELQRELMHYQNLVNQLLGRTRSSDEYDEPAPIMAVDAASARVVNSIIRARVPASASFRDFEEEEL